MNAITVKDAATLPRILIVDDDLDILDALRDVLELEGNYSVKTAADATSAKQTANIFLPDIALLDVKLGYTNGLDLIPVLKERIPTITCIVMTAYKDTQYAVKAVRLDADDYIHKPLDPLKLVRTLDWYLAQQRLEREKREAERSFHAVFEQTFQFLFLLDSAGLLLEANQAALTFTDSTKDEVVGTVFWKTPWWQSAQALQQRLQVAVVDVQQGRFVRFEVELQDAAGKSAWFDLSLKPIFDEDGQVVLIISEGRDITELKQAQAKVERLAYYDELTGLPNRRLLLDHLHKGLAAAQRHGMHGALLFFDLDRFKIINDTLGHAVGDTLLQQVAERLAAKVRAEDTVARLGGDEFVVLLPQLSDEQKDAVNQAKIVADKLCAILAQPYNLQGHTHHVTPSIGVVLFPTAADTVDDLLKRADIAMYRSKAEGRNTVRFYDPGMQITVDTRLTLD